MHELLANLLESPEPIANSTSATTAPISHASAQAPVRVATPIRPQASVRIPATASRTTTRPFSSFPSDPLKRIMSVVEAPSTSIFSQAPSASIVPQAPSVLNLSPSSPLFFRAPPFSAIFNAPEATVTSSSPPSMSENSTSFSSPNSSLSRDGEPPPYRPQPFAKYVQASTPGVCLTCNICQQSFATRDFLTRHIANHQNESPKKRRRIDGSQGVSQSFRPCRFCATARVGCDDSKPCRRCVRWQIECVPSSEPSSAGAVPLAQSPSNNHTAASWYGGMASPHNSTFNNKMPSLPAGLYVDSRDLTDKAIPPSQYTILKSKDGQMPNLDKGHAVNTIPVLEVSRVSLFDVLREMLYQQPPDQGHSFHSQSLAVLDFCDDADLQLTDIDFSYLALCNMETMARGTVPGPKASSTHPQNPAEISQTRRNVAKIWTESPWRWKSSQNDALNTERGTSSVLHSDMTAAVDISDASRPCLRENQGYPQRVADKKLYQSSRDRVLAMALSNYRQNSVGIRLAASFPVVDVMDSMVHTFLEAHRCQVSQWIHFPSLTLNTQSSEWIGVVTAAGAILTAIPSLRKFGFALQETARKSTDHEDLLDAWRASHEGRKTDMLLIGLTMASWFEEDNEDDREDIVSIQTVALGHDLGIWSANRRKMRVAESRRIIPVTMMRHGRKFQYSSYPQLIVDLSDEGEILDAKWRLWVEKEQWKRLVFHCFIQEAQFSMTNWTSPCMSYAELLLPLPESRELWFAETASEWKKFYLHKLTKQSGKAPTIGDLFQDIHHIRSNRGRVDIQLSISVFLHGFWSMILEYRQLGAIHNFRSFCKGSANLLLSFRHQELVKGLQTFASLSQDWHEMSAQEHMIFNLLMMNLHVSLDDLQLFLGKRGDDEARRIYPILQEWVSSHAGRSAVWYAGQVLRYAKMFPRGHLRDFHAVAIYHASLGLWTYGVIFRASQQEAMKRQCRYEPVYLDGDNMMAMQRFLESDQRKPLIKDAAAGSGGGADVLLYDTARCMDIVHEILQNNFRTAEGALPAIVENLCQLIKHLGKVAWAISSS